MTDALKNELAIDVLDDLETSKNKFKAAQHDALCNEKLIGAARTKLKSEIAAHENWEPLRALFLEGKNTGQLTKVELIATGIVLDLDMITIMGVCDTEQIDDLETSEAIEIEPAPAPVQLIGFDAAKMDVDKCLRDAEPWISPKLANQLSSGVAQLVDAATREIADAENAAPAGNIADGTYTQAKPCNSVKASTLFGGMERSKIFKEMDVTQWDAKDAPRPDAKFVFEAETLRDVMVSIRRGRTVYLTGPAGTGKTSLPREIAARLNRPFTRIAHTKTTEPQELKGANYPSEDGGVKWHDGVLTQAIRKAGNIILLDEPSFCRGGILAVYQTLLDHRYLTLEETGEVVKCAQGVTFVIADNTAGNGDMSGRYADTNTMNAAFLDRSAKIVKIGYLPKNQETAALVNHTSCNETYAEHVVKFAGLTRLAADKGEVTGGLSFRRLIEFTYDLQDGVDAERAFENCIINLMPDDDGQAALEMAKAHLDFKAIEQLALGKDTPTPKAKKSKAAQGFSAVDPTKL